MGLHSVLRRTLKLRDVCCYMIATSWHSKVGANLFSMSRGTAGANYGWEYRQHPKKQHCMQAELLMLRIHFILEQYVLQNDSKQPQQIP